MSTRAIIRIFDEENKELVCIYQHGDGYPQWCGKELTKFICDISVVNGISFNEKTRIANGYECLAAQLVCALKTTPGGVYIYPPGAKNMDEEYEYEIHPDPRTATNGIRQPYLMMYAVKYGKSGKRTGRKLLHAGNAFESINYLIDEYKVDFALPVVNADAPIKLPDPDLVIPG